MKTEVKVWETSESVTILAAASPGAYRVIWHRSDGKPEEEFEVTPVQDDSVVDAVVKELRRRVPS